MPQSNQRGIETLLNLDWQVVVLPPQSNQRGIETENREFLRRSNAAASIEPAWD